METNILKIREQFSILKPIYLLFFFISLFDLAVRINFLYISILEIGSINEFFVLKQYDSNGIYIESFINFMLSVIYLLGFIKGVINTSDNTSKHSIRFCDLAVSICFLSMFLDSIHSSLVFWCFSFGGCIMSVIFFLTSFFIDILSRKRIYT